MADLNLAAFDLTQDQISTLGALPTEDKEVLRRRLIEMRQSMVDQLTMARGPMPRQASPAGAMPAMARAGVERGLQGMANLAASIPNKAIRDVRNFGNMPEIIGYERLPIGATPIQPDVAPVMAGIDMAGEAAAALATGNMGQFSQDPVEAARLRTEALAQQQPMATTAGRIGADVASLLALRSPAAEARGVAQWEAAAAAERAAMAEKTLQPFAPSVSKMLQRIGKNNESINFLKNRAGRVTEAGLEGAVVAIMTSADPQEMAAWAAGTQAAGSASLAVLGGLTSGGVQSAGTKLALAAAGTTALIQTFKSISPGGDDWILPSVESAFNKVAATVGIGMISGILGTGRIVNPKMTAQIADSITAAQRGGLYSVLSDAKTDSRIEVVTSKLATNPEYFGPTAMRRMERAYRNPNISISGVIDDLMENDRSFRQKYLELEKARQQ